METVYRALLEQKEVRRNLSTARAKLREGTQQQKEELAAFVRENENLFLGFLESGDAKTRKNTALLLGDICCESALEALYRAYRKEETLFVRSAYLDAMAQMDVSQKLPEFKEMLAKLLSQETEEAERKHIEEEIRGLRRILIRYEGIVRHTFDARQTKNRVLLLTNRNHRQIVQRQTGGKVHPLGVMAETDQLLPLLQVRTYREMVFPLPIKGLVEPKADSAADILWEPVLTLCRRYHKEDAPFYFRVECRAGLSLEERSRFTKKLGSRMEQLSGGLLVNSEGNYEVELRLIANREGFLYPCIKFYTLMDKRFAYRKNAISASIHPSSAALMMELAAPYLKEGAQIMDPFCGVGTMLIERDIRIPARHKYGTDIFGQAIDGARENASLAGEQINFIHRDFFDFRHEYLFDEIVTNMPVRGRMTREELDCLYERFFQKALTILKEEAVMILYTGELGFVKKQIRLHKEFSLLQEHCMQRKTGFYLLIIGVKREIYE